MVMRKVLVVDDLRAPSTSLLGMSVRYQPKHPNSSATAHGEILLAILYSPTCDE